MKGLMKRKQKTVIIGMAGNILLSIAKLILSFISGSNALLADALHSFSDLLVSLLVLAGMKVNKKKIEAVVTLFVGILIISVAIGFVLELFLGKQPEISNVMWTVCGQIVIIIATYILYKYKTVIGLEEQSQSLIADGLHTKSDMFSSLGVLISLTGALIGLNLDKAAAFIIFFLILYQGLETILSAVYLFRGKDRFYINVKIITDKIILYLARKKNTVVFAILLLVLLTYLLPGFYFIEQNQSGIRTVLGVPETTILTPGLHFDPLHPVSTIRSIATSEIQNLEYGFSIKEGKLKDVLISQMETIHNSHSFSVESDEEELITGDGSIVNIFLIVEYRVSDPYSFVSYTEDPEQLLRIETGSQLQKIIGSLQLFDVINRKRAFIEEELSKRINNSMDFLKTGILIEDINIYTITPHLQTAYMYRNVQDEEQYKKTLIYDAQAVKSRQIPFYRGLAYEKIIDAGATAREIILKAERDAAYYKMIEREYELNREAVVYRLGLDSRVRLLKDSKKILIENSLEENLIRLNSESGAQ